MLTLTDIVELCRTSGRTWPEEYMVDNWMPHNWVINAIQRAYKDGQVSGTKSKEEDNV
jgi:hypothetical protein